MRSLALTFVLVATGAAAQEAPLTPPPVMPTEEAAPAEAAPAPTPAPAPAPAPASIPVEEISEPSYWQRCFAVPAQVWIPVGGTRYRYVGPRYHSAPLSNFHGAVPITTPPPSSGGSPGGGNAGGSSGGSGGGGDWGKGALILAVVLIAALPVVVFALDADAPAVVEQRFFCPTMQLDAFGGLEVAGPSAAPSGLFRTQFAYGYIGGDVEVQFAAGLTTNLAGHLLFRFKPKKHVQLNVAAGVRSTWLFGGSQLGFEIGLPHRYVFWRSGLQELGLELRPSLIIGVDALDAALEGSLVLPLFEPMQLRLGGRVQSVGTQLVGGVIGGVSLAF